MRKIILCLLLLLSTSIQAHNIRILFIGDSITDGGWGKSGGSSKTSEERNHVDMNHIYGHSYMFLCASHYQSKNPEQEYEFFNRGISGYTLTDLEKRWEKDVIALKPDVISILIGTNDIDNHIKSGASQFDFTDWENRYSNLLKRILKANPNTKFILCSPFIAHTGKMKNRQNFNEQKVLISQCAQIVEKLARDFCCIHIPFDKMFDELIDQTPTSKDTYWIWDGIHPTPAGHQQMANLWIQKCDKYDWLKKHSEQRVTIEVTSEQLSYSPDGPFEADWQSIVNNYKTPDWFKDAKFGIFIHWGLYSVPAAGSEWYPKHMYNGMKREHEHKWGKQNKFGYKDFIPLFKAEKFDANKWAKLFRDAGARYVIPTAEHHDGFAMYDSDLTQWNAKQMGPHRDIIGELAKAVRNEGMKFGVSNHRIENWDFMYPLSIPQDSTDLFLPEYASFYGPPQKPGKQSGMGPKAKAVVQAGATEAIIDELTEEGRHPQNEAFLNEWELRVHELIDKYQPDLLYFDNGINYRSLDPWKLRIARYYYNSAWQWGKQVSIQSKGTAYLAGSIKDYERESRAPKQLTAHYWQVDDPIGNKFGYIEGLKLQNAEGVIRNLIENISKNGNLCLNVSPRADGTIPEDQQKILYSIGEWLQTYGEGVYETRAYKIFGEGPHIEGNKSETDIRFTIKGNTLFAFVLRWDGKPFTIHSLQETNIRSIINLSNKKRVKFIKQSDGIRIKALGKPTQSAVCFKIELL